MHAVRPALFIPHSHFVTLHPGASVGAALLVAAMDKNGESYLRTIGTIDDSKEPEVVKLKDIAEFPASLWCLFFICVTFYISIFVFIQNGSLFLSSK